MKYELKKEGKFTYHEVGEGTPIVILHGLMGGLSNFDSVIRFFPEKNYKILIPELPLYSSPLLKTTVANFAKFLK
ncbi:MAG: alpha/beta hydrolase, partial [Flavobacteriaceae bacterium]|nr:alpha/beta hydrolase [Flavobacteriaceae bacterium]